MPHLPGPDHWQLERAHLLRTAPVPICAQPPAPLSQAHAAAATTAQQLLVWLLAVLAPHAFARLRPLVYGLSATFPSTSPLVFVSSTLPGASCSSPSSPAFWVSQLLASGVPWLVAHAVLFPLTVNQGIVVHGVSPSHVLLRLSAGGAVAPGGREAGVQTACTHQCVDMGLLPSMLPPPTWLLGSLLGCGLQQRVCTPHLVGGGPPTLHPCLSLSRLGRLRCPAPRPRPTPRSWPQRCCWAATGGGARWPCSSARPLGPGWSRRQASCSGCPSSQVRGEAAGSCLLRQPEQHAAQHATEPARCTHQVEPGSAPSASTGSLQVLQARC